MVSPSRSYKVAVEGLTGKYARFLRKCTYAPANDSSTHATACRRARVGSGKVENLAGPHEQPDVNSSATSRS